MNLCFAIYTGPVNRAFVSNSLKDALSDESVISMVVQA
jgi:hypothetical protein